MQQGTLKELLKSFESALEHLPDILLIHLEIGHANFSDVLLRLHYPITPRTTQPEQYFFQQLKQEIYNDWRQLILQLVLINPSTTNALQIMSQRTIRYERLWLACSGHNRKPISFTFVPTAQAPVSSEEAIEQQQLILQKRDLLLRQQRRIVMLETELKTAKQRIRTVQVKRKYKM